MIDRETPRKSEGATAPVLVLCGLGLMGRSSEGATAAEVVLCGFGLTGR